MHLLIKIHRFKFELRTVRLLEARRERDGLFLPAATLPVLSDVTLSGRVVTLLSDRDMALTGVRFEHIKNKTEIEDIIKTVITTRPPITMLINNGSITSNLLRKLAA